MFSVFLEPSNRQHEPKQDEENIIGLKKHVRPFMKLAKIGEKPLPDSHCLFLTTDLAN